MLTPIRRRGLGAMAALMLAGALAPTAQAGTGITHRYCTNRPNNMGCLTDDIYIPSTWTVYVRVEMQGRHCAGFTGGGDPNMLCSTPNYVYSHCSRGFNFPRHGLGVNQSGVTRNMEVWLFRSTGGDCH